MYFTPSLLTIHLNPRREFHHWNPNSEKFASLSNLASAVLNHWQVSSVVIDRIYAFSGGRITHVYYFELRRSDDYMTMPIIQSPAVFNLLKRNPFHVVPYRDMREAFVTPWSSELSQRISG